MYLRRVTSGRGRPATRCTFTKRELSCLDHAPTVAVDDELSVARIGQRVGDCGGETEIPSHLAQHDKAAVRRLIGGNLPAAATEQLGEVTTRIGDNIRE